MEKIKWSEKVNKKVFESIGEKKTVLNNILHRKANWISDDSKKKLPRRTNDGSERSRK